MEHRPPGVWSVPALSYNRLKLSRKKLELFATSFHSFKELCPVSPFLFAAAFPRADCATRKTGLQKYIFFYSKQHIPHVFFQIFSNADFQCVTTDSGWIPALFFNKKRVFYPAPPVRNGSFWKNRADFRHRTGGGRREDCGRNGGPDKREKKAATACLWMRDPSRIHEPTYIYYVTRRAALVWRPYIFIILRCGRCAQQFAHVPILQIRV